MLPITKNQRKRLAKESFQFLLKILDSDLPDAVARVMTPYTYKGTDGMTDDELVLHHRILQNAVKEAGLN